MTARIHVAAGVIVNRTGDILIARRPDHLHQGGLWEFPGGKVELEEHVEEALKRELHEELGISVTALRPLIHVHHDYPDKSVFLDVWHVDGFDGNAQGREGQAIEWVSPQALSDYVFPAANKPIVLAARLPDSYLITPEPDDVQHFLSQLEVSLSRGISLVQLRAHSLDETAYCELADKCLSLCRQHGSQLLLNRDISVLERINADGVHLTASRLSGCKQRPVSEDKWLGVSCHNERDLEQAANIDADFAVIAPVKSTSTHPDANPIGWKRFKELSEKALMPVYALGGMQPGDREQAWQQGAQGIAAIRGLWAQS